MERLTEKELNGDYVVLKTCNKAQYDEHCIECAPYCIDCEVEKKALKKLKAYEDAEEQGRLIRLPCKVGDTVYHERPYVTLHTGIQAFQITNIMISQNKKGIWNKKYRAMHLLNGKIIDSQINFSFDDIGKTVFLTREEAEAALERIK